MIFLELHYKREYIGPLNLFFKSTKPMVLYFKKECEVLRLNCSALSSTFIWILSFKALISELNEQILSIQAKLALDSMIDTFKYTNMTCCVWC